MIVIKKRVRPVRVIQLISMNCGFNKWHMILNLNLTNDIPWIYMLVVGHLYRVYLTQTTHLCMITCELEYHNKTNFLYFIVWPESPNPFQIPFNTLKSKVDTQTMEDMRGQGRSIILFVYNEVEKFFYWRQEKEHDHFNIKGIQDMEMAWIHDLWYEQKLVSKSIIEHRFIGMKYGWMRFGHKYSEASIDTKFQL